MDNRAAVELLQAGAGEMGLSLDAPRAALLVVLARELLRWNERMSLTAIDSLEVALEKHVLDSLAVVPALHGCRTVLDLGTGAGFPGLVLKVALPAVELTLVDSVGKKVGFVKHALALLGLSARAVRLRAEGEPAREGLVGFDAVVSRALLALPAWLKLASPYAVRGGRIVAMLGRGERGETARAGEVAGLTLASFQSYALPFSGDARALAVFRVVAQAGHPPAGP